MTEVTFFKNNYGIINRFRLEGHADFSPNGTDIVCAGISAVTFGVIEMLENIVPDNLIKSDMANKGYLDILVVTVYDTNIKLLKQIDLITKTLETSLKLIAETYPANIKITYK